MSSKNNKESAEKIRWYKKGCIIILCIVIAVILFKVLNGSRGESTEQFNDTIANIIEGKEGKVSTISEASLEAVFEINELSTADYTYNAIAKAYKEDGETIKYYVAYEGKIKAGIDFSKINIDVNEGEKTITITIPDIEFTEKTVNPGTLEYIFKDKKSETETVHQEAFKICEKDLAERIDKEDELMVLAEKNAVAVVEALVTPWVEQIDDEYKVEIQ